MKKSLLFSMAETIKKTKVTDDFSTISKLIEEYVKIDNQISKDFVLKDGRVIIEEVGSGLHQFELNFKERH